MKLPGIKDLDLRKDKPEVEPIKAWRGWAVNPTLYMLHSVGVRYVWPPGVRAKAEHLGPTRGSTVPGHPPTERSPVNGCKCGFWGVRQGHLYPAIAPYGSLLGAIGTVSMWGKIIEWKDGWKSEFAYPDVIYATNARVVKGLARLYQVDVVYVPTLDVEHLLSLQEGGVYRGEF